jgi:hypothetical protein
MGDGLPGSEGVLGLVVAEWTRGAGLTELVARHPPPADTCGCSDRRHPHQ